MQKRDQIKYPKYLLYYRENEMDVKNVIKIAVFFVSTFFYSNF